MNDDEFNKYVSTRYQKMLEFYDKEAVLNKRYYKWCSVYVIVASFLLAPIVSIDLGRWRLLVAILSSSIGMAAALSAHFKFHENWLRYRSTWDCLQHEHSLHKARVGAYRNATDPNGLFVEHVEAIFAKEGSEWFEAHACIDNLKKRKDVTSQVGERRY